MCVGVECPQWASWGVTTCACVCDGENETLWDDWDWGLSVCGFSMAAPPASQWQHHTAQGWVKMDNGKVGGGKEADGHWRSYLVGRLDRWMMEMQIMMYYVYYDALIWRWKFSYTDFCMLSIKIQKNKCFLIDNNIILNNYYIIYTQVLQVLCFFPSIWRLIPTAESMIGWEGWSCFSVSPSFNVVPLWENQLKKNVVAGVLYNGGSTC